MIWGDLVSMLENLLWYLDNGCMDWLVWVVIEIIGFVDLVLILYMVMLYFYLVMCYWLESVVILVDVVNGFFMFGEYEEVCKQVVVVDCLVLIKIDFVESVVDCVVFDELQVCFMVFNFGVQMLNVQDGEVILDCLFNVGFYDFLIKIFDVVVWLNVEVYEVKGGYCYEYGYYYVYDYDYNYYGYDVYYDYVYDVNWYSEVICVFMLVIDWLVFVFVFEMFLDLLCLVYGLKFLCVKGIV